MLLILLLIIVALLGHGIGWWRGWRAATAEPSPDWPRHYLRRLDRRRGIA